MRGKLASEMLVRMYKRDREKVHGLSSPRTYGPILVKCFCLEKSFFRGVS